MARRLGLTGLIGVLALAALTLSGCLGVDVSTKFNGDGSGVMTMKLQISQMLLQMGEEQGRPPVPLTKEELEKAYAKLDGVKVQSVTQENNEKDRVITAVISFKDFGVFRGTDDLAGTGAQLTKENGLSVYRVLVGEPPKPRATAPPGKDIGSTEQPTPETGAQQPLKTEAQPAESGGRAAQEPAAKESSADAAAQDEAMTAMIKGLMAGYSIQYSVSAPKKIVSHTVGELSADGKTVTFSMPIADYMDVKEPIQFEVKW